MSDDNATLEGYRTTRQALEMLGVPQAINALEKFTRSMAEFIRQNTLSRQEQQELLNRIEELTQEIQNMQDKMSELYEDVDREYRREQGWEQPDPEQTTRSEADPEQSVNERIRNLPQPDEAYAPEGDGENLADMVMAEAAKQSEKDNPKIKLDIFGDFDKLMEDAKNLSEQIKGIAPKDLDIDHNIPDDFELGL